MGRGDYGEGGEMRYSSTGLGRDVKEEQIGCTTDVGRYVEDEKGGVSE